MRGVAFELCVSRFPISVSNVTFSLVKHGTMKREEKGKAIRELDLSTSLTRRYKRRCIATARINSISALKDGGEGLHLHGDDAPYHLLKPKMA